MKRPAKTLRAICIVALTGIGVFGMGAPVLAQTSTFAPAPSARLVTDAVVERVRDFATAEIVQIALSAHRDPLPQAEIDALDTQWRQEREADDQPLITSILSNPLSTYLLRIQAQSVGLYTEIFIMDMSGLNAGQSAITSDFWQGDEAKFQKTAGVGPTAVFIDEPEYNEGTATWRIQVNLSIADGEGTTIGAITAELNLTELQRRARAGLAF